MSPAAFAFLDRILTALLVPDEIRADLHVVLSAVPSIPQAEIDALGLDASAADEDHRAFQRHARYAPSSHLAMLELACYLGASTLATSTADILIDAGTRLLEDEVLSTFHRN